MKLFVTLSLIFCYSSNTYSASVSNDNVYQSHCSSGVTLGLETRSESMFSDSSQGGSFIQVKTKITDATPYLRKINDVVVEVNDNLFYEDLVSFYPALVEGRKDTYIISELSPSIKNLNYQKDQFDQPKSPSRIWRYDFYGHDGNNRLLVTDHPLKVTATNNGNVISSEVLDSPKIMKTYEFFPRLAVPNLIESREHLSAYELILPNMERIVFDKKTGKIIDGAFKLSSKQMKEYKVNNLYYHPTHYQYTGNGVWIETVEKESNGDSRRHTNRKGEVNYVNVKKSNSSLDCRIPSSKLWNVVSGVRSTPEEYKLFKMAQGEQAPSSWGNMNTSYICYKFKYENDSDFDSFLKNECGFGLY